MSVLLRPKMIPAPATSIGGFVCRLIIVLCVCLTGFSACTQSHASPGSTASSHVNVRIKIVDSLTNMPTPVRVRITKNDHHVVKLLPKNAIAVMYGLWDHADGYGFQPDSAFYVDGFFNLSLNPGRYTVTLSKGIEYLDHQFTFSLTSGSTLDTTITMMRWINMPLKGWYSADNHIHIRRSPREDSLLIKWIQAEDIHVGVLLKMGDFWATYYPQYGWGEEGVYQEGNYLLTSGQEDPRTPELGHSIGFGASDYVRNATSYYYYDNVFDKLHQLGGITGYAHQAESFHGYRGLILDGLRRKVDVLEPSSFAFRRSHYILNTIIIFLISGMPLQQLPDQTSHGVATIIQTARPKNMPVSETCVSIPFQILPCRMPRGRTPLKTGIHS